MRGHVGAGLSHTSVTSGSDRWGIYPRRLSSQPWRLGRGTGSWSLGLADARHRPSLHAEPLTWTRSECSVWRTLRKEPVGATTVCKVSQQVREPPAAGDPRKALPAQPMVQSPVSLALTLAENSGMRSRKLRNDGIQTLTHCGLGNLRPARLGQAELSQENRVLLARALGCRGQQAEPTASEPSLIMTFTELTLPAARFLSLWPKGTSKS